MSHREQIVIPLPFPAINPRTPRLPDDMFLTVQAAISFPSVDLICYRSDGDVLAGFRIIPPYRDVWSFIGGIIRRGEHPVTAVKRQLRQYGIRAASEPELVGVFPANFPTRKYISLCYAVEVASGPTRIDDEFSKFEWFHVLPKTLGRQYQGMMRQWKAGRRMREVG
jgi:ADP-ribose pyrophosphatase YjhB (NUDIX family)